MTKLVYALLLTCMGTASTQLAQARSEWHPIRSHLQQGVGATPTLNPTPVPTVIVPHSTPIPVPTLSVPKPAPKHKHARTQRARATPTPVGLQWMWAFLTSYCPGTAGWLASSGRSVFYGMLANDYYPFGTRVFMPVLGMTGVVEDRFGGAMGSEYFDVWSPVCYGTPTGWFKVAVVK